MRLKHIKIAGFKSFVDPTTIPLSENMTCIVGPNGCGKSNTIDAVRWVMGESSAKHLRGDSKTDVIFAGSSGRKPVSQASVELLFDNSDHTIVGEYAQYSEISVRRVVHRDGQSQYYLNNTKCRRRDVTELFLGTGLGPRSYAIIEQGMISNLITAKPEELRHFLEEAAGISKYKERRRETEQRMQRTRDNLERLYDIREELNRQLQRLEKQAADAEVFKGLQAQKRQKQAELAYLRFNKVQVKKAKYDEQVRREEVSLEVAYAGRREAEAAIEQIRQGLHQAQTDFNAKQQSFYQVGTAITKLEEAQKHQQRHKSNLTAEQQQIQAALQTLKEHQAEDMSRRDAQAELLATNEPELELLEDRIEAAQERFDQAQDRYEEWQSQWQDYISGSAAPREASQVAQAQIQQHEKVMSRLGEQQEQLLAERQALAGQVDADRLQALQSQQHNLAAQKAQADTAVTDIKTRLQLTEQHESDLRADLSQQQAALSQAQGRLESLLLVHQKTLQVTDKNQLDWLEAHDFSDQQRLAEVLQVPREWQAAVEALMGQLLTGLVSDRDLVSLAESPSPQMTYFLQAMDVAAVTVIEPSDSIDLPLLSTLLQLPTGINVPAWLQGVYLAKDLTAAEAVLPKLRPYESVLIQDGSWLGLGWACLGQKDDAPGLLVLQQDLDDLQITIAQLEAKVSAQQTDLTKSRDTLQAQRQALVEAQQQLQQLQQQESQVQQELSGLSAKMEQIRLRRNSVEQTLRECQQHLESEQRLVQASRKNLEESVEEMARYEDMRLKLEAEQEQVQQAVRLSQDSLSQDQDRARTLSAAVQYAQSSLESVDVQLQRLAAQITQQEQRLADIQVSLDAAQVDQAAIDGLPELLQQRQAAEAAMTAAKDIYEHRQHTQAQQEKLKREAEAEIDRLRTLLESLRIQVQAQQSDAAHIRAEMQQYQIPEDTLALAVPEQASEAVWTKEIASLEQQVAALGAINLAAVEEFQSQSERKIYMDEQFADLESALFTLEEAIEQIDEETRERFQKTFDQINEGMGQLFPRLFGGGQAQLDLVGDDILTAGVAIMARPPGKKNTSIHMLSGGEKALTAISLVFAIFQLNPAPFCMLDEVDAPLDDANVGRYADMVKHMSETVQFIYISHNKIAMEKAEHLMGVTMQEPGVSRLVSVDITEASALAIG